MRGTVDPSVVELLPVCDVLYARWGDFSADQAGAAEAQPSICLREIIQISFCEERIWKASLTQRFCPRNPYWKVRFELEGTIS
jgi:predicted protein tyrosine phosphatase